jgi:hypothetical protein
MENLKEYLKVDRIIRISDKGCFIAKIVAETVSCWFDTHSESYVKPTKKVKQGFDLIASMKLNEQYLNLLENAFLQGHHFILLDYLSLSQARKKNPSEQDRYYGMSVESNLTYGQKEYPMRFIFIRSDGKIKRDRNRREKCLVVSTPIPKVMFGSLTNAKGFRSKQQKKQITKIEAEIKNLQEKVGMPYYRDAKKLKAKIDLLCKRYPEGRHLKVELLTSDGKAISFSYEWDKEALEKEAKLDGIYLLGTTLIFHPIGTVFRLFLLV